MSRKKKEALRKVRECEEEIARQQAAEERLAKAAEVAQTNPNCDWRALAKVAGKRKR